MKKNILKVLSHAYLLLALPAVSNADALQCPSPEELRRTPLYKAAQNEYQGWVAYSDFFTIEKRSWTLRVGLKDISPKLHDANEALYAAKSRLLTMNHWRPSPMQIEQYITCTYLARNGTPYVVATTLFPLDD